MDKVSREYRLGIYEKAMPNHLTWKERLSICKEYGFDYLEMSIDESEERLARLNYTKEERKEITDAIWETNVPIHSICLSGHRLYSLGSHDDHVQKRALEIMEKAIVLASDLGVRIIQLAGYDVYYEESDAQTKANFIKNLRTCVNMAMKYGVYMGFETMETPFMDTVEKAMEYVLLMDSPYLGVYPDIGNLKNASLLYHVDTNCDLGVGKAHILAAHLKECKVGKYREIPYGQGHTDFCDNMKTLKDLQVRMFVGEFWYRGEGNWKQDISDANIFLRTKLDAIFN